MASKQKRLRSSALVEEKDANLGFKRLEHFPSDKLPTLGEVIGHILHLIDKHHQLSYENVIQMCGEALHKHWTTRNVYPTYLKRRLKKEIDEFRKLKRTAEINDRIHGKVK